MADAGAAELATAAQNAAQQTAKLEAAEKLAAAIAKQHSKPDARLKLKIDELQARAWYTISLISGMAVAIQWRVTLLHYNFGLQYCLCPIVK